MNIGIFTDTYYPQINGVAVSSVMLEKELGKLGHKVYIFTTSDPHMKIKLPRVFRLPSMPFIFLPSHRVALIYPPKLLLKLKTLNLDVVHTQTEFGVGHLGKIVSKFYKLPIVHTYHTMYEDYVHYFAKGYVITPKMAKIYMRNFCNKTDAVISPVRKTKEALIESGVTTPIKVIPTGLDFESLSGENITKEDEARTRAELGLKENDKVVLFVGRVAKEKSIDVIMRQIPKLLEKQPNCKFVIVGGGPLLNSLKEMSGELEIEDKVIFAGAKPWKEVGRYYKIADVFTTASTSETQGLTYVEAMIAKKPVVAKKDESVSEIIEHGETGFYFEEEEDVAEVLDYVLSNRELAERVAEKGFEQIQHLSAKQFAKNVEAIYLELILNHKKPYSKNKTFLKNF